MNAITATETTIGTNQPATLSTSCWIGARERCALATISTIRESVVSCPTRVASMMSVPVPLSVAPVTLSPTLFSTGIASPVSIDSSTDERPSTTVPSTGIFSPGRTRKRVPALTFSSGTSSSRPSSWTMRAVSGARSSNALSASPVRSRARSSMIWPRRTRTMITAAAS